MTGRVINSGPAVWKKNLLELKHDHEGHQTSSLPISRENN